MTDLLTFCNSEIERLRGSYDGTYDDGQLRAYETVSKRLSALRSHPTRSDLADRLIKAVATMDVDEFCEIEAALREMDGRETIQQAKDQLAAKAVKAARAGNTEDVQRLARLHESLEEVERELNTTPASE